MGLLGALFAGVSGLESQSNAIGIISNNISNVNTVGFKQGEASFDTLVVPSGTSSFSPGGVIGNNEQLVDQQGLIQATASPTDIAITGGGLLVVNTTASGTGNTYYTRAGSFTQDAEGNFVNSDGYYLQGLPILADGQTAQPDTQNLVTVNVSQSATGTATPTSIIDIVANLNSQQSVFPGNSATATLQQGNGTSADNASISASTIIVGNDYDTQAPLSNLKRGASLVITSGAPADKADTFTYGGFTVSRSVLTGANGDGDNALVTESVPTGLTTLGATPYAATTTSIISGINVAAVGDSAVGGTGQFVAGSNYLTIGTSGGSVMINITANETLTEIATAIQTAVAGVDAGSTATISGTAGNFAITVVDAHSNTATGISGLGLGTLTATGPLTTSTTMAINGLDVTSPTATGTAAGDPFGPGGFSAGTLTVAGTSFTIASTESLNDIVTDIETNVPGATATVTGSANNYGIAVTVPGTSVSGITGTAVTSGAPTFTLSGPYTIPKSNQVEITVADGADYTVGGSVSISGVNSGGVGGLTAAQLTGQFTVAAVSGDTVTVQLPTGVDATSAVSNGGGTLTVSNTTYPFTGNIMNADTATEDFLTNGSTPAATSDFASDSLHFTVAVGSNTPLTFTYNSNPNPTDGQFNSLTSLASAINDSSDSTLTATVQDGRIYVSAANANDAVTFTNGDEVGNAGLPGINWTQELDLQNQAGGTTGVFNTLAGLAQQINTLDPDNLTATVNNPTTASSLSITEANPEQTITFTDGITGQSVLKELGFANLTTNIDGEETTGTLNITYSATGTTTDMSSGAVAAQHTFDVTVYDAEGNAHNLALNVLKTAANTWAVELTAVPASDVTNSTTDDGQIASGTLIFNGDGTISPASTGSIFGSIAINWSNKSSPSTITVDLGQNGGTGLTQANSGYALSVANQNGSPVGQLTGVSVDSAGYVIASFSNGETQKEFQIPLADVSNPDGLAAVTGNAYSQTLASGIPNLELSGSSGVGTFTPSALEESNVDLSTQLTNLIVAQQAYGANSKVLTIADQLLQELDQVIQS